MRPDEAEVIKPASADGLLALNARDIANKPVSDIVAHRSLVDLIDFLFHASAEAQ